MIYMKFSENINNYKLYLKHEKTKYFYTFTLTFNDQKHELQFD